MIQNYLFQNVKQKDIKMQINQMEHKYRVVDCNDISIPDYVRNV